MTLTTEMEEKTSMSARLDWSKARFRKGPKISLADEAVYMGYAMLPLNGLAKAEQRLASRRHEEVSKPVKKRRRKKFKSLVACPHQNSDRTDRHIGDYFSRLPASYRVPITQQRTVGHFKTNLRVFPYFFEVVDMHVYKLIAGSTTALE